MQACIDTFGMFQAPYLCYHNPLGRCLLELGFLRSLETRVVHNLQYFVQMQLFPMPLHYFSEVGFHALSKMTLGRQDILTIVLEVLLPVLNDSDYYP